MRIRSVFGAGGTSSATGSLAGNVISSASSSRSSRVVGSAPRIMVRSDARIVPATSWNPARSRRVPGRGNRMAEQIEIGFQAFVSDGGEEFGAVREVSARDVVVYVENAGDFRVPRSA